MNKALTRNIIRAIILMMIQVLILKRIAFEWGDFAFIHFIVYPVIILLLPIRTPKSLTLIIAFVIGLIIDMFYDSPGIHASALVFSGYSRTYLLAFLEPYEGYNMDDSPTMAAMGFTWFLIYASLFMAIHLLFYFSIEAFSFVFIFEIVMNSIFSFIASMVLIMLGQLIFRSKF